MLLPYWGFRGSFSTPGQMREVLGRLLDDVLEQARIDEDLWYDLKIILHELCCNAVEHGKVPAEVFATICSSDDRLHILVCDQGGGFDHKAGLQACETNAERGRGLHIVKCLADDIMFNSTASRVLVRMKM